MKTSAAGRAAILQREGCVLSAYRDTVGVLTIGVGHTGRMAPPTVTAGMQITKAQADSFLAADLAPVEAVINAVVTVPMTQNQFDAMASLAFNIGVAGFRKSSVVRDMNEGKPSFAADAFMLWNHPAGLTGRREAERKQFLTPDPTGTVAAPQALAAKVPAVAPPQTAAPAPVGFFARLTTFLGRH